VITAVNSLNINGSDSYLRYHYSTDHFNI